MSEIRLKIMGVIKDMYLLDSREGGKKSLRIHFQTTYLTKIFAHLSTCFQDWTLSEYVL